MTKELISLNDITIKYNSVLEEVEKLNGKIKEMESREELILDILGEKEKTIENLNEKLVFILVKIATIY